MTLDNNAIEAGLGHFVKTKKKVDFVGKQALQEITKKRVTKATGPHGGGHGQR